MAVGAALAWGRHQLEAAATASPMAEARTLLAHVAQIDPARLALVEEVDADTVHRFRDLVARRATGIPVQHLTGRAWFRTVELEVGPGVFIPRPETEVMTGWAIDHLHATASSRPPGPVVVELCTGSGAIALAIATEVPTARLHACERDPVAAGYARRNLLGTGVDLIEADMAEAFSELEGSVDLLIANPPYIPLEAWESVASEVRDHDPHQALFSGQDGLDAMRVVATRASRLLRPGGVVCAEHAEAQHESAPQVFLDQGSFAQVRDHRDLTGRHRFVTAVRTTLAWQDGRRE